MDGLHAHSHSVAHVGDGDRYPAFPVNGHGVAPGLGQLPGHRGRPVGHSRGGSYGSIDAAAFALPT